MPSFKLDRDLLAERESLLKSAEEAREEYEARVAEAVSLSDHAWGKWLEVRNILETLYEELDEFRMRVAEEIDLGVKTERGREKWAGWMDDLEDRIDEIPDMKCEFDESHAIPIFDSLVDDFRKPPVNLKDKPVA